jgi:toxin ParE1/3/4
VRIVRAARAEEDLIDIWTYIAMDNDRAADRVFDELERKPALLAHNPNIGREPFDAAAGVHSLIGGSYLNLVPNSLRHN